MTHILQIIRSDEPTVPPVFTADIGERLPIDVHNPPNGTVGVYSWTHIPSEKKYVGSSVNCRERKNAHKRHISKGSGFHFHKEAARIGLDNFVFEMLEVCRPEDRLWLERSYIERLGSLAPNGYNIKKDPENGPGYIWSENMRATRSALTKARFSSPEVRAAHAARLSTPEARAANSARSKARMSRPEVRAAYSAMAKIVQNRPGVLSARSARAKAQMSTPEARLANSLRAKAQFSTQEARAAHAAIRREYFKTPKGIAQKAVFAARIKAYWLSPFARAAQSNKMKSIQGTQEARAANSARAKARFSTPEARAMISYRMKAYWASPQPKQRATRRDAGKSRKAVQP